MLNEDEIKKIIELRLKKYSYKKIHQITGFSIGTIAKYCKQYEKQNMKARESFKIEITKDSDPILTAYNIEEVFSKYIEIGNLSIREKTKLKKILENLRLIIRTEVDERISKIKAETIEKTENFWKRHIIDNYVRKEIVEDLNNEIREKDEKIIIDLDIINEIKRSLKEKENEKLNIKKTKDREIQELKDNFDKIYNENIHIKNQILIMQEYIDKKLYDDIKSNYDILNLEIQKFNYVKDEFFRYIGNKNIIF